VIQSSQLQVMQSARDILDMLREEMGTVASVSVLRLVVAAVLGGVIGLEREFKKKAAGLRTNMFICIGSAMFTILSNRLADMYPGDHTRIAAQIIPGIGFIGAGSILHARGAVTGLTTAATIFVVASVGMAVGGGLYLTAIFATGMILVALYALGRAEAHFESRSRMMSYEVSGKATEGILAELNCILDEQKAMMQDIRVTASEGLHQVRFSVEASQADHERLGRRLRQSNVLYSVSSLGGVER
jgi:putative Mg2+ transporter-C (MgtC) family protein